MNSNWPARSGSWCKLLLLGGVSADCKELCVAISKPDGCTTSGQLPLMLLDGNELSDAGRGCSWLWVTGSVRLALGLGDAWFVFNRNSLAAMMMFVFWLPSQVTGYRIGPLGQPTRSQHWAHGV